MRRPVLLGLSLLCLTWSAPVRADESPAAAPARTEPGASGTTLTQDEAIRLALARNFVIQTAAFGPRIANANLVEAAGAFDPVLGGSYNYTSNDSTSSTNPFSTAQASKTDDYETSLSGKLPFGLNYSLVGSSIHQRGLYYLNGLPQYFSEYSTFGGIRLSQPLLRGFGFGSNLAGIRVARANRTIAQAEYRQAVIDTITRTIAVYNNLYFTQQAYEISVRSRDLASGLLRENRRRVEVGSMAPAEVTIAEARVAQVEDGIIQTERGLRDTQNQLRALISNEARPAVETPLVVAPPKIVPMPVLDKPADLAKAFARRPDYQQALAAVKKADANFAANRTQILPQVDLVGGYGYAGNGASFDEAYRQSRDGSMPVWYAGAVVSVPLGWREGRGRFRAAKLGFAQAQTDAQRIEQDIVVAVANAAGQIDATSRRLQATRHARELAAQSLTAEQKLLQVGRTSTFQVLQFQELLSGAEMSEYRAIADYNIALAEYDRAIGGTLESHGVTLDTRLR